MMWPDIGEASFDIALSLQVDMVEEVCHGAFYLGYIGWVGFPLTFEVEFRDIAVFVFVLCVDFEEGGATDVLFESSCTVLEVICLFWWMNAV